MVAEINNVNAALRENQLQYQKEREVKKLMKERAIEGDGRGRSTISTVNVRQADMKSALETGDIRGYITKHWLKQSTAE
jgi:hypothetical protein